MERENKKLKKIPAQKDEKFNRMVRKKDRDLVKKDGELVKKGGGITKRDKELDTECRLWKSRAADGSWRQHGPAQDRGVRRHHIRRVRPVPGGPED